MAGLTCHTEVAWAWVEWAMAWVVTAVQRRRFGAAWTRRWTECMSMLGRCPGVNYQGGATVSVCT